MLPTYDEVLQLTAGRSQVIPAEYIDSNGHLNVRHFVGIFDDCGTPLLLGLGMSREWLKENHRGVMDLENHIRYIAEVLEGETVSVYGRFIERSPKAVHWMEFLVNDSRRNVAATLEMVTIHVDLDARKAIGWSDDVAKAMDAEIAKGAALTWAAPISGCLAIKR